ncbi:MAG: pitrilysin family protein [Acidobacteriota bacterium]
MSGAIVSRVQRTAGLPVVTLRLWWRAGALIETQPGLALVTGRMLAEGSRRRSWDRLAAELESRGMSLVATASHDLLGVGLDALAGDWREALDLLAEVALEPSFPTSRLAWIRRQVSAELDGLLDPPDARARLAFLRRLYGTHPYARPPHGDAESLRRIESEQCRLHHARTLDTPGCLAVVGEIEVEAVEKAIRERFGAFTDSSSADSRSGPPLEASGEEPSDLVVGGEQSHLFLGHPTVERSHPDRPALELAGVILGAGAGIAGRLPTRVREVEGLAYSVGVATTSVAGLAPGHLMLYVGTSPERVEQAERSVRDELERFVASPIDPEELESARAYLLGREPFRRETVRQQADRLAEAELYGLAADGGDWLADRVRRLSAAEIERAVRRWLRPDALEVVVGRPR